MIDLRARARDALLTASAVVWVTIGAGLVLTSSPRAEARIAPRPQRDFAAPRPPIDTRMWLERDAIDALLRRYDENAFAGSAFTTFCGGGGSLHRYASETPRRAPSAKAELIAALREGRVEEWERPDALVMLAEAQLASGEPRRAAVNYRRALAIDPEGIPNARVGLATALYFSGARRAAHDEAKRAREIVCSSMTSHVACYTAHTILARTARDPEERDAAERVLRVFRSSPGLAWELDAIDRRLSG